MVWIDQSAAGPESMKRFNQFKQLGDAQSANGDFHKAVKNYQAAIAVLPDRFEAHVALGMAAFQTGDLGLAQRAFETAFKQNSRCEEACAGLAMIRQQCRDFQGAFDLYLKCLELNSDNMVALLGLFQASGQMGTFAKIIGYLEIYLQRHPDDSSVLFCLASLYAREGKWHMARKAALGTLVLEPGKPEAVELLCKVEGNIARCRTLEASIT